MIDVLGGEQKLFHYENGYGASVVRNNMSYGSTLGKWELAVTKGCEGNWELCYSTPITDDVIGWLDWPQVEALLEQIKSLPAEVTD